MKKIVKFSEFICAKCGEKMPKSKMASTILEDDEGYEYWCKECFKDFNMDFPMTERTRKKVREEYFGTKDCV